jgi:hypothetical protein
MEGGPMGLARWYNAQKVTVQAAAIGGVLAIVGGLVTGAFSIVNTELARPDGAAAALTPKPTLASSIAAPATTSSAAATATASQSASTQVSPSPSSPFPRSSPSPTPAASRTPLTAVQIAQDITGDKATNGSTVRTAHCSLGSVQLFTNGSAQADCDLTFSNDAVMRASVTVYSNGSTTWNNQYQENLTAADFENVLVGRQTISDGDVVSATCYQSTLQKESDGYTQVECVLTLGNNTSHETTVTYNGISSPTWT